MDNKDCSEGLCSLYCPQWCYIIYPPPPPFEFPDESSSPNFSPLVIAIIGILASAFLLVSYYTLISKYCGNGESARSREDHDSNEESEDNHNPSLHEPWHVATTGLDEALIKTITAFKYKKEAGLVEGTDCSVCLGEFQEDETVRLLPKCSHVFHLPCIDTWLKSHSNCPLCRANIVSFGPTPLPLPALPLSEVAPSSENLPGTQQANENVAVAQDMESCVSEEELMESDTVPKNSFRASSDLSSSEERDTIIEIRDGGDQQIGRSFSMDFLRQSRPSVADILQESQDEGVQVEEFPDEASSSKQLAGEVDKSSNKSRVLHFVTSPIAMKRSFSSGRFFLTRHGRRRPTTLIV